jgi:hypothetical protein
MSTSLNPDTCYKPLSNIAKKVAIIVYLFNAAVEDCRDPQARHLLLSHRLQSLPGIPEVLQQLLVTFSGQLAGLSEGEGSAQQLTSILVCPLSKQRRPAQQTSSRGQFTLWEVESFFKNVVFWDIKTQFVPHRRHITSLLQSPAP